MRTPHHRLRSLQSAIILLSLLLASASSAGFAQGQRGAGARQRSRESVASPKLVVVIVVDQFRYDFLDRFADLFGTGGFRRLMNQGALFTNANLQLRPDVYRLWTRGDIHRFCSGSEWNSRQQLV